MISEQEKWERYWNELPAGVGHSIWDSDPSVVAAEHLPLFQPHFTADLPLLDIGCGNGTQTAFLAKHYPRVIGLDVSDSAVRAAQVAYSSSGISFRQFDLLDREATEEAHTEFGDCNIYLRTVLHLFDDKVKKGAVENLAQLVGETGGIFAIEITDSIQDLYTLVRSGQADWADKLNRALSYGITAGQLADGEMEQLATSAGIRIIASGRSRVYSTATLPDGQPLIVPAVYMIGKASVAWGEAQRSGA
ncbi:class I SAM-dependent methyltransferase [Streptomyces sp. NPDC056069]|uniref:class I SAM-dependent methyltransferase n=1 Tax=Streptomyces sp. NPDC056069 TaxID=3345702 RepID=UPI0035E2B86D